MYTGLSLYTHAQLHYTMLTTRVCVKCTIYGMERRKRENREYMLIVRQYMDALFSVSVASTRICIGTAIHLRIAMCVYIHGHVCKLRAYTGIVYNEYTMHL